MLPQHSLLTLTIAAILAPFSYYAGRVAQTLKLPQITGYLIAGIICGPYVLGILSVEAVSELNIIEGACLSIIGLAAGAELDWAALSKSKTQVMGITTAVCISSWILCYAAFELLGTLLPSSSSGLEPSHLMAMSTLGATLMMTRSPASAIAVLKEVDGKGPFCSLVMAVVVVKDVMVIITYAINIEIIRMVMGSGQVEGGAAVFNILAPLISVAIAIALGVCGGLLLNTVLRPRFLLTKAAQYGLGEQSHAMSRIQMVVILLVATCVFQLAHSLDAEPLLACVTMGMVAVNRKSDRAEKEKEELLVMLANIMSFTNVAFFSLAGASLKLSSLTEVMGAAMCVCVVRAIAIYLGSWVGCTATGTTYEVRRLFWASMVTQAGVAMGLARLAGTRFPDWGPHFQTFMMAIILINLLVGPPLFRSVLVKAGESRPHSGISLSSFTSPHSHYESSTASASGGEGGLSPSSGGGAQMSSDMEEGPEVRAGHKA